MRSTVMIVFIKSWKNATEQHYKGNKTNKNDGTELERALNSLIESDMGWITAVITALPR